MARRIQRKRTAGWRMPAGAVCVARPGRWGNPFALPPGADEADRKLLVKFFRECLTRAIRGDLFPAAPGGGGISEETMARFRWMAGHLHLLRGKDLCCFCRVADPCHADVLLELAAGRG